MPLSIFMHWYFSIDTSKLCARVWRMLVGRTNRMKRKKNIVYDFPWLSFTSRKLDERIKSLHFDVYAIERRENAVWAHINVPMWIKYNEMSYYCTSIAERQITNAVFSVVMLAQLQNFYSPNNTFTAVPPSHKIQQTYTEWKRKYIRCFYSVSWGYWRTKLILAAIEFTSKEVLQSRKVFCVLNSLEIGTSEKPFVLIDVIKFVFSVFFYLKTKFPKNLQGKRSLLLFFSLLYIAGSIQ